MFIGQEISNKIADKSEDSKMIDVIIEDKYDIVSDIMSFDESDVDLTIGDYIDEMLAPMEDLRVYDRLVDALDASDYDDIKIITTDSVNDVDKFDRIFNKVSTKLCKDIGDYSIVDLDGYKVGYSYQEGGYPVLLVKM